MKVLNSMSESESFGKNFSRKLVHCWNWLYEQRVKTAAKDIAVQDWRIGLLSGLALSLCLFPGGDALFVCCCASPGRMRELWEHLPYNSGENGNGCYKLFPGTFNRTAEENLVIYALVCIITQGTINTFRAFCGVSPGSWILVFVGRIGRGRDWTSLHQLPPFVKCCVEKVCGLLEIWY